MSDDTLALVAGSPNEFATGLIGLGWFTHPPRLVDEQFAGKARARLSPKLQSAGQVKDTGAWVYRLELPPDTPWGDARTIVESHLRQRPQFAVVFCPLPGKLCVFVPEDPDKAFSRSDSIKMAPITLDTLRPANFETEMLKKLRAAPENGFRRALQDLASVERITTSFYREFDKRKDAFIAAISGIAPAHDRKWYASVVLNRLMFIYFLQENDFLDHDSQYLHTKFAQCDSAGRNYYRDFLYPLFFKGLALREEDRSPENRELLGSIPYLNGGLFLEHRLESDYPGIQIENDAFRRILDFFKGYTWYIDDRPLQTERQLNPDVLGHIFEKYVNQKEMGAYYTKPDITGYICRNTIIPRLFDMLAETGPVGKAAVEPIFALGRMESIAEYVYLTVKTSDYLPTETEREYRERRRRYESILQDFCDGKIRTVNDFITYNLDIEQMASDFVDQVEDAQVLRDFYFKCVRAITILDPTCGSGAFLLMALEILFPLYDGCLRRMQVLMGRAPQLSRGNGSRTWKGEFGLVNEADVQQAFIDPGTVSKDVLSDFRDELERIGGHSRDYYIHKTIIVNNLFGVDIEEEAVEICKLRLFLKLIAHAQPDDEKENRGIEPLPDIDFNILSGNALVGYVSYVDVDRMWERCGGLPFEKGLTELQKWVGQYRQDVRIYRQWQLGLRPSEKIDREVIASNRKRAKATLDEDIWRLYRTAERIKAKSPVPAFLATHRPFHWFLEFPHLVENAGFDVLIGNPPYVEIKDVLDYTSVGFETAGCRDLYANILERGLALCRQDGRMGYIVPLSAFSVERFADLQRLCLCNCDPLFVSHWSGDAHPSKLFEGVDKRLQIILARRRSPSDTRPVHTSKYIKWYAEERPTLFARLPAYQPIAPLKDYMIFPSSLPKVALPTELGIITKLKQHRRQVGLLTHTHGKYPVYYTRKVSFFLQFLDFIPEVRDSRGRPRPPSEMKTLYFSTSRVRNLCLACLSSSLFYWYNIVNSDCRNLNRRDIVRFPVPDELDDTSLDSLEQLVEMLMTTYRRHATTRTVTYASIGDVTVQYFNFRPGKSVIDEIDRVLARHYGFTDEELDFIINYDIKYRMGRDSEEE